MKETVKTPAVIAVAEGDQFLAAAELREEMAREMDASWDEAHPGWRQRYVEYFRGKQETGQGRVVCARVNGQVVGMASVSIIEDYHRHVRGRLAGRVNAVFVKPEFRRQGIASAVMRASIDWLKEKGCSVVRLNSSEEGVKLYESLGFKPRREMELKI